MSKQKSTEETSSKPSIPQAAQVGDFIIARYKSSRWARWLPWENWHHAALVSSMKPFWLLKLSVLMQKTTRWAN